MTIHHQQIQKILKKNLFISPLLREKIISFFTNLNISDSEKKFILNRLQSTSQKQNQILKKILEKNPYFFQDFKKTIKKIQIKKLSEKEAHINQEELENLEKAF